MKPSPYPDEAVLGPWSRSPTSTRDRTATSSRTTSADGHRAARGSARTWGSVIGIWPRHLGRRHHDHAARVLVLVPGRGFGVENYGTDPNIEGRQRAGTRAEPRPPARGVARHRARPRGEEAPACRFRRSARCSPAEPFIPRKPGPLGRDRNFGDRQVRDARQMPQRSWTRKLRQPGPYSAFGAPPCRDCRRAVETADRAHADWTDADRVGLRDDAVRGRKPRRPGGVRRPTRDPSHVRAPRPSCKHRVAHRPRRAVAIVGGHRRDRRGVLAGALSDAIGPSERINILAPPVAALVVWNLVGNALLAPRRGYGEPGVVPSRACSRGSRAARSAGRAADPAVAARSQALAQAISRLHLPARRACCIRRGGSSRSA